MEMLQLRYFFESAKNESFAKTAKKYMVPTTSVSASVRRLEAELGCVLFDRTGNSIALNQKGREFFESVRHIFSELDSAVLSLNAKGDGKKQKISIYAPNSRSNFTTYINTFRNTHPQAVFLIDVNFNETDYAKYDILVVRENEKKFSEYEGFIYRKYSVKVEALEENPLCDRRLTLSQLRDHPFVSTGLNNEIYKTFIKACERQGFHPNFVYECNDYNCVSKCLHRGVGFGITLSRDGGAASSGMKHLNISDFNEPFNIYVYYKKQVYNGVIKDFIDYLKSVSD